MRAIGAISNDWIDNTIWYHYLSRTESGKNCVTKNVVANKKKIDIDLPLFWGQFYDNYAVWCPDKLHNTDGTRFYNTCKSEGVD